MAFVLSFRFERVARLLLVLLLAEGLPLRAVTETGLALNSGPGAGSGLPGELPPALPETRMDGVGLTRVGDEAFEFDSPAAAVPIPGKPGWMVVAMQRGELWCVHPASGKKQMFLDFRRRMQGIILFEEGVHGIVFHPQFASNGQFYLSYSQNDPRRSLLVEMSVKPGHVKSGVVEADPTSERVLIELPQPLAEHWGGGLTFGPDGCLYYGIGDGGLRDDPYRLAQNPWSLNGKVLRLDVDTRTGSLPYGIPKDNPFAHDQMARAEIWAMGLRNPWGLHFDPMTRDLWCADVGQDFWEEINLLQAGGNYGWSDRDGPWPLPAHVGAKAHRDGAASSFIEPVHAYSRLRGEGLCIIGGFVYRGKKMPALQGQYVFADWAMGRVWSLEMAREGERYTALHRHLLHERVEGESFNPTVIVPDPDGEPLALSQDGSVFRVELK
jgi:quinoprotein glucose dehydrogenase